MRKDGLRRSLHGLRHVEQECSRLRPWRTSAHFNAAATLGYNHALERDKDVAATLGRSGMLANVIEETHKIWV
jgi:hypothetical protein